MPRSKREAHCLSILMSLMMIYIMAALNDAVRIGDFSAQSWLLALKRLPLGFLFGIACDLLICTPLSRRIVMAVARPGDRELYLAALMRFCMVVLMTFFMTIFGTAAAGRTGPAALADFSYIFPIIL